VSKALDALPCKACKVVCRLGVSAILAHFGVPYLVGGASDQGSVGVSGAGEACRNFLIDYPTPADPGPLAPLLEKLGTKFVAAIGTAFAAVGWVFDVTDRLYTKACEILGCCKSKPAVPA
jgi:hypothetical protein